MRFHHHQLEKVKKHQRSHTTNQARAPRDQGESESNRDSDGESELDLRVCSF